MTVKPTTFLSAIVAFTLSSTMLAAQQDESQVRDATRTIRARAVVRGLERGYLGVQLTRLTPELRAHFGAPEDAGVMVARVEEGGPAEAAGIRVGDIVTAVDGERVDDGRRLSRAIGQKNEGESVTLELYRDGSLESYPVTIAKRERPVIDLAGGYGFFSDGDALPDHDVFIAPGFPFDEDAREAFEEAMRELEDGFDSPEWQEKMERMKEMDFGAIQDRMKQVEQRLEELETEIEKETPKK